MSIFIISNLVSEEPLSYIVHCTIPTNYKLYFYRTVTLKCIDTYLLLTLSPRNHYVSVYHCIVPTNFFTQFYSQIY